MSSFTDEIERLVRQGGPIRELARRLVRDAHAADDLVQEAALLSLRRPESARGPLGPWLAGVVRNLASGFRRSRIRSAAREAAVARPETGGSPPAAETAERIEQQRRLIGAVLALEEPYRSAILLRWFEGLPQREIAKRLGVPAATVNSRLTRALARLRERLDEREGGRAAWIAAFAPLLQRSWIPLSAVLGAAAMKTKLVLAAALAAALVWWTWPDGAAPSPVKPGPDPGAATEVAEVPPDARGTEGGSARDVVVQASPFADRSERDPGPDEPPSIAVFLKDLDGQPVAGAEVLVLDPVAGLAGGWTRQLLFDILQDPESPLPRNLGPVAVSDASGCARIPAWPGPGQVFARRGGLTGQESNVSLDGNERLEVTMYPVEALDVRVVDDGGRPLGGIPVALRALAHDLRMDLQRALTGPDAGRARIGWTPKGIGLAAAGQEFAVALAFPLPAPVETPLDPLHPPSGPLTLACPETGSVVVEVLDGAGKPAPDGTGVSLGFHSLDSALVAYGSLVEKVQDGRASFPFVGLGIELTARVGSESSSTFHGPTRAGESIRISMTHDVRRFAIRGRLLREDRSPRAGAFLSVSIGSTSHVMARAGPDGRFEVQAREIGGRSLTGPLTLRVLWNRRSRTVALPWNGDVPASIVELGDVVVPDMALLAAGDVVDTAGQPVAKARVEIVRPHDRPGQDRQWVVERDSATATTDSRGRFEIFGTAPDGAHLDARDAEGMTRHEPVPLAGPGPYRLVLHVPSSFSARLTAPEGFPFRRVRAGLWPESKGKPGPMEARGWLPAAVKADGSTVVSGLEPGEHTFGIHTGTDEAAVLIPGIRIGPGPENRDPRLDPLDLGGVFRLIRLRVRDDSGRTLRADAHAIFEDGTVTQLGRADGALVIARRKTLATVIVAAEGTFARSLGPIEGEHEVTLARGIAVPMAWPADVPLPAAPVVIRVSLEPETDDPGIPGGRKAADCLRRWSASLADLPAGGRVGLRAPAPGAFRVRLVARKECGGWTDERDITPDPPPLVAVSDPAPSTPFPIPVDPALLDRALATLGRR